MRTGPTMIGMKIRKVVLADITLKAQPLIGESQTRHLHDRRLRGGGSSIHSINLASAQRAVIWRTLPVVPLQKTRLQNDM